LFFAVKTAYPFTVTSGFTFATRVAIPAATIGSTTLSIGL
jgi:hypothetical protein